MDTTNIAANAEQAADLLKTLSNPNRLMVLCFLLDNDSLKAEGSLQKKELSVNDLNQFLPLSQSALSQHLAYLRQMDLVCTRREGLTIFYRLNDPENNPAVAIIKTLHQIFCPNSNNNDKKKV